jgi:hypothetical protein
LLKEYPGLEALIGLGYERRMRNRLVEMAKVLCKYPWIVEVIRQRLNNP